MKTLILVISICSLLTACGKQKAQGDDGDDTNPSSATIPAAGVSIKDGSGSVVAYFLSYAADNAQNDYYANQTANAYVMLPDGTQVEIDLLTGQYVSDRIANVKNVNNLTDPYSMNDVLPNTVIYVSGSGYYKASGARRTFKPLNCTSSAGVYTIGCSSANWTGVALTSVPQPYDFTAIAPISLQNGLK